jgi:hypothetical protein
MSGGRVMGVRSALHRQLQRTAIRTLTVLAASVAVLGFGSPTPAPGRGAALPAGIWPRLGRDYTLLDPTVVLPPLEVLAPELALLPRDFTRQPVETRESVEPPSPVKWKVGYRHAQLSDLSSTALRTDPSTGFSRQLDTDVLALGMSWQMAGSRVGLAYQLQSARGGTDSGLSRFLPTSDAATHALTLGVTREFGASLAPPAPPPLLMIEPAAQDDTAVQPTPSPAS